jgi:N-acetylneuraminate synthase
MKSIQILDRKIGCDYPVYFIADIAANHDGDLERAKDLIYLAAEAGADAAKFQNFRAETIVSDFGFRALGDKFSHQANWENSVFDVYDAASLPLEWTPILNQTCIDAGIHYFTAPYEIEMVVELSDYVCAWKIGSGDITWLEHIKNIARLGKPVMLATGAAEWEDVERAAEAVLSETDDLVLMQCNTNYTGSRENFRFIGLNVLKEYTRAFPMVLLGLSDHTPGHTTVLGAVALGARVIEKHFTDDVARMGPDHTFSMDPVSWKDMVSATEDLDAALGDTKKRVMDNEQETVVLQRRAIRAGKMISAGEEICKEMLIYLRPCPTDGIPPFREELIIGKRANRDIAAGDCIRQGDVL